MLQNDFAVRVMAIINLTPDSFWSGSRSLSKNHAVKKSLTSD